MPNTTTAHTVIGSGNGYSVVAVGGTHGTRVKTTLTDAGAVAGTTHAAMNPAVLSAHQMRTTRQLFAGGASGKLGVSYNGGATWATSTPLASAITALAAGETASAGIPHAYAGTADGHLLAWTETQSSTSGGAWTTVASLGSAVTALAYPRTGNGRCWVATQDGTVRIYSPLIPGAFIVATFTSPVTALACRLDPTRVYGLCAQSGAGLIEIVEAAIGGTVLSYDSTRTYTALSVTEGGALLAAAGSVLLWSPDEMTSYGTLASPSLTAPYTCVALDPSDPNEFLVGAAAGAQRTLDNASSYGSLLSPGLSLVEYDRLHRGAVYGISSGALVLSYDVLTSSDTLSPLSGTTVTAFAQGSLMMA